MKVDVVLEVCTASVVLAALAKASGLVILRRSEEQSRLDRRHGDSAR